MPLVVLCGHPCSGKSTVAAKLQALVQARGVECTIIDEQSLHLNKNTAHATAANEKNARGALKSAVDRTLSKNAVTILDYLNFIKGYRYELWCIARSAATRYCMVHVDTAIDTCRQWNQQRQQEGGSSYQPEIFEDLAGRFERPDSRNRWDSPLFTIRPPSPQAAGPRDSEEGSAEAEAEAEGSERPPDSELQAILRAMLDPEEPNPHAQVAKDLQPTFATSNPTLLGTNVLHEIDQAAQDVITKVMDAQEAAAGGAAGRIQLDDGITIQLNKPVTLSELRRHKRGFMKLATKVTFARLQGAGAARHLFADYLTNQLQL